MKLHTIKLADFSDIHQEVSPCAVNTNGADVLILNGDINVGLRGINWAADMLKHFPGHIIYVAGNHEFYHQDIHALRKAMRDFCSAPEGWTGDDSQHRLHFLENDEVIINGVRFLGCTLWTDFKLFGEAQKPFCMIDGGRALNDFRLIRNGEWNFSPQDSIDLHEESAKWLEMKLKREPFPGATVVITHHAPSFKSVVPRYQDDLLSACFASNLDQLMGFSELWIHGHMHDSLDYMVEGTRVICNPRGYCRYEGHNENDDFNPNMLIEVGKDHCEIVPVDTSFVAPERPKMSARRRDAILWKLDGLPVREYDGKRFIDLYALMDLNVRDIVLTYDAQLKSIPDHIAIMPLAEDRIEWLVEEIVKRSNATAQAPKRRRKGWQDDD